MLLLRQLLEVDAGGGGLLEVLLLHLVQLLGVLDPILCNDLEVEGAPPSRHRVSI